MNNITTNLYSFETRNTQTDKFIHAILDDLAIALNKENFLDKNYNKYFKELPIAYKSIYLYHKLSTEDTDIENIDIEDIGDFKKWLYYKPRKIECSKLEEIIKKYTTEKIWLYKKLAKDYRYNKWLEKKFSYKNENLEDEDYEPVINI